MSPVQNWLKLLLDCCLRRGCLARLGKTMINNETCFFIKLKTNLMKTGTALSIVLIVRLFVVF